MIVNKMTVDEAANEIQELAELLRDTLNRHIGFFDTERTERAIDALSKATEALQSAPTKEGENKERAAAPYRPITDLSDEEIRQIAKDTFNCEEVACVERVKEWDQVEFLMTTYWETCDGTGKPAVEPLEERMRISASGWHSPDGYPVILGDDLKLMQFLYAKGCHPLGKDNPYLEDASAEREEGDGSRPDCEEEEMEA